MKRILFICSGNMFRSAGAEFILRKKLQPGSHRYEKSDFEEAIDCFIRDLSSL